MLFITRIDIAISDVAHEVHAIQMASYRQEANLFGMVHFPPLDETVDDILKSKESFVGAFDGQMIIGVLSVCHADDERIVDITSLVVRPDFQRKSIGRSLVGFILEKYSEEEITVQTAAANVPALALYFQMGFEQLRKWVVGAERLELIKLRRMPASIKSAA